MLSARAADQYSRQIGYRSNLESGILEEGRDDPRSTFQGQRLETPWDDLQMAYFNSHALMERRR
jgi:hypothetical protein